MFHLFPHVSNLGVSPVDSHKTKLQISFARNGSVGRKTPQHGPAPRAVDSSSLLETNAIDHDPRYTVIPWVVNRHGRSARASFIVNR